MQTALKNIIQIHNRLGGKFYIGISLNWNYIRGVITLSMTDYVKAALHKLQHKKMSPPQDLTFPWNPPNYGNKNKLLVPA
mmetsp:Transcript_4033/g.11118  ORF Transcript_4033/g.11118 Transcript_4033/m.11118 type:complete len:80 (+) Transcript_4033:82-321(+)